MAGFGMTTTDAHPWPEARPSAPEELDAPGWSGVTDPASYYPAEPVRERQAPPRSRATGTGPPPPGLDR